VLAGTARLFLLEQPPAAQRDQQQERRREHQKQRRAFIRRIFLGFGGYGLVAYAVIDAVPYRCGDPFGQGVHLLDGDIVEVRDPLAFRAVAAHAHVQLDFRLALFGAAVPLDVAHSPSVSKRPSEKAYTSSMAKLAPLP
jgi:hypothetical protein